MPYYQQSYTSFTKPNRKKVIIFVTFFVILLFGSAGTIAGLLYNHFQKSKSSNDSKPKVFKSEDPLPFNNANDVNNVNTIKDELKTIDHQDTPLIINKPDSINDQPVEDRNIIKPINKEDTPVIVPRVDNTDEIKKKNQDHLKEQEIREQNEEKIKEQKKIDEMNRKQNEEKKKELEEKKKEQENKIEIEPKKIDQDPDVKPPKSEGEDFKDKMDRKQNEENIDRSKEVNKVLDEVRKREQEDQPNRINDPEPNVVLVLGKEAIFERLVGFANKKGISIVEGEYENCIIGRCKPPHSEHVFDWELKLISEIMDEAKKPFNLKYEFETLKLYQTFAKKFRRLYATKEGFKGSYKNFRRTRDKIEKHNKNPDRLYNMDYTTFSDMRDDTEHISGGPAINKEKLSGLSKTSKNLRDQVIHIDWRDKGYVTEVIHQGSCGSCWAVAATDVFNSFAAKNNKEKVRYSHQQLVDCVSPKYNCSRGGSQFVGLQYIRDNKMCTDKDYPYIFQKNQCSAYKCEKDSGIKEIVKIKRETALDFLKENGPFLTFLNCTSDFLLYGDGIFNGKCSNKNAHSVVVVGHGYDKIKKVNYWIVKNSWGKEWGEDGYYRILDEQTDPTNPSKHFCNFLGNSYGII